MPGTIEVSTKLIALITAVITLIAALIAFRKNKTNVQQQEKVYKGADSAVWEMVRFFAGFLTLMLLFLLFMIGMRWGITVFSSIK
jgi:uncharacterized membrane protein YphA (DoxX/SURF4 family)